MLDETNGFVGRNSIYTYIQLCASVIHYGWDVLHKIMMQNNPGIDRAQIFKKKQKKQQKYNTKRTTRKLIITGLNELPVNRSNSLIRTKFKA